ncbi:histidinol-phosphatase, partial [Clostridium perfringens]|nr:histidinol-phosphatase [Clostridium perfringens]
MEFMLKKINFHTHTKRCKHAKGEDKDYIDAA